MNPAVQDLRQRFAVYGRFYEARWGDRCFQLRSHLEVFERDIAWPDARRADADLVAIMMNPGASRPLETPDANGWALAVPDRTQYQLMRLALHAQSRGRRTRHIRVINLSDLRTPKSTALFATLASLDDARHSIFCPARRDELARALGNSPATLLVRAWGLSSNLAALANVAVDSTRRMRVLGLTNDGRLYGHPLPQRADLQRRWLTEMQHQLDAIR